MIPPGEQPYLQRDVDSHMAARLADAELRAAQAQARADHAHRLLAAAEEKTSEALAALAAYERDAPTASQQPSVSV